MVVAKKISISRKGETKEHVQGDVFLHAATGLRLQEIYVVKNKKGDVAAFPTWVVIGRSDPGYWHSKFVIGDFYPQGFDTYSNIIKSFIRVLEK